MLTSWSEVSTPAELSMASVLMRPPLRAYSMRPRCVTPRLAPSPMTRARTATPSMRNAVIGAVADLGVALIGRLDEGADAAEPQEIDLRLEDRLDRAPSASGARPSMPSRARISGDSGTDLRSAREHAAALGDERLVVVRPGRARQVEEALALLEAKGGIGVGIEEDVAVVERGEQPSVGRAQHAVAEDVARHVADADAGEVVRLDVACRARGNAASPSPRRRAR